MAAESLPAFSLAVFGQRLQDGRGGPASPRKPSRIACMQVEAEIDVSKLLPETEMRIFLALSRLGAATAADLARRLGNVLATTVYSLLQRMEKKGLVASEIETQV